MDTREPHARTAPGARRGGRARGVDILPGDLGVGVSSYQTRSGAASKGPLRRPSSATASPKVTRSPPRSVDAEAVVREQKRVDAPGPTERIAHRERAEAREGAATPPSGKVAERHVHDVRIGTNQADELELWESLREREDLRSVNGAARSPRREAEVPGDLEGPRDPGGAHDSIFTRGTAGPLSWD
jgi:hypothetical protein